MFILRNLGNLGCMSPPQSGNLRNAFSCLSLFLPQSAIWYYVCVCVCVCVRERKREFVCVYICAHVLNRCTL